MEVDVLRGAWFLRRAAVPLVFRERAPWLAADTEADGAAGRREAGAMSAVEVDAAEAAFISLMLRRHGDLRSIVLPSLPETALSEPLATRNALALPPPVTAAEATAWRREIWRSVRRADRPPHWRSPSTAAAMAAAPEPHSAVAAANANANPRLVPQPEPQPEAQTADAASSHGVDGSEGSDALEGGVGGSGAAGRAAGRRVALLVVPSAAAARHMDGLYAALRARTSRYEPRLVLPPGWRGGCAAAARLLPSLERAHYELHADGERQWPDSNPH
jgi:hypothetical protein